jgi:hypothetical protein
MLTYKIVLSDIGGYAVGGLIVAALRAAGHQAACSLPHYTSTDTQIVVHASSEADARSAVARAIIEAREAVQGLRGTSLPGSRDRTAGCSSTGVVDD